MVAVLTEALAVGLDRVHHLAWWVEDWPAREGLVTDAGWEPVTDGDGGGMARFASYDVGGP